MVKRLPAMWETRVRFPGQEDPLEKEMAIYSSILAWKVPWTEEPDRLQSMGSQRVGHDWVTSLSLSVKEWERFRSARWQCSPAPHLGLKGPGSRPYQSFSEGPGRSCDLCSWNPVSFLRPYRAGLGEEMPSPASSPTLQFPSWFPTGQMQLEATGQWSQLMWSLWVSLPGQRASGGRWRWPWRGRWKSCHTPGTATW